MCAARRSHRWALLYRGARVKAALRSSELPPRIAAAERAAAAALAALHPALPDTDRCE